MKENEQLKQVIAKLSKIGVNVTKTKSRRELWHSLQGCQSILKSFNT